MSRVLVIGFCDTFQKLRGTDDIVFFREEHQFECGGIPKHDVVREHATAHGYYPSGMVGAVAGKCDPVYRYLSTNQNYPDHTPTHRHKSERES